MQEYSFENTPYELLNGEIVYMSPSPTPTHNTIVENICRIFGSYLKGKQCRVFGENVDVYFDEKNKEVRPDVKIVCNPDKINFKGIHGAPDLVVEVLSPSTARNDRGYKKNLYAKHGVKEYWIVDTTIRSIEVYILQDGVLELNNIYQIYPDYEIEKMTIEGRIIITEFKTSLYDDLVISIDDVFDKLI